MTNTRDLGEIGPDHQYYVTGRGQCFGLIQPDPPVKTGDYVKINGQEYLVASLETYAVEWGADPGQPVGLLVKELPDTMPEELRKMKEEPIVLTEEQAAHWKRVVSERKPLMATPIPLDTPQYEHFEEK